ncbi:MAG: type II secretion system F family protein [Candidatus Cloacimonetes bacterium]|nr:type II secretion system F family protein [Candidatus Cloacimonadota bacterium]NLO11674.1 type II secretion system F family protein [Candidatus Cloacimonadota bacterium]
MAKEYRFRGVGPGGKPVQGTFMVNSARAAKAHIANISQKYQLRIDSLERKRDYLYKVMIPNHRPFRGRQSAYTKEEVEAALIKMGYQKFKISPVLLDINIRPSKADIMMFIKLSATMLRDKMNFGKILEMLAEEQNNRVMKDALLQIESQLRAGMEGREVFNRFAHVFGKFPAYMLGLATRSGSMADVFEATSKFIERDMQIRKSIRSTLITPAFAILATIAATAYYVMVIFPQTAELFLKYDMELPTLTRITLELSEWLGKTWYIWLLAFIIPALLLWWWWSTPRGRIWRDRNIVKIPILGNLIHKMSIEVYFRVFSVVYAGAGDNIETIATAAEACRNAWMEDRIKKVTIPRMLKDGEAFVPAMAAAGVFTRTALTRLRTGQETGNILQSTEQIATYYEAETTYKINNAIEYIQTLIAFFIGIIITLLTVVSADIAAISPPTY